MFLFAFPWWLEFFTITMTSFKNIPYSIYVFWHIKSVLYMLTLDPRTMLHLLNISKITVWCIKIFMYSVTTKCDFFLPNLYDFFSCLIALARTSTMKEDKGHPYFISHLQGNALMISPWNNVFAVDFLFGYSLSD